ncbi:MAG: DUF2197 domain-containing protein [Phormidesmis sp.]
MGHRSPHLHLCQRCASRIEAKSIRRASTRNF